MFGCSGDHRGCVVAVTGYCAVRHIHLLLVEILIICLGGSIVRNQMAKHWV